MKASVHAACVCCVDAIGLLQRCHHFAVFALWHWCVTQCEGSAIELDRFVEKTVSNKTRTYRDNDLASVSQSVFWLPYPLRRRSTPRLRCTDVMHSLGPPPHGRPASVEFLSISLRPNNHTDRQSDTHHIERDWGTHDLFLHSIPYFHCILVAELCRADFHDPTNIMMCSAAGTRAQRRPLSPTYTLPPRPAMFRHIIYNAPYWVQNTVITWSHCSTKRQQTLIKNCPEGRSSPTRPSTPLYTFFLHARMVASV